LGGDVSFIKNAIETSLCLPVGSVDVGLSARAGLLVPHPWVSTAASHLSRPSLSQSNLVDRFFLGGPLDVRGFLPRGLGPRAGQDSLGGDVYWAAGAHVYTPLPSNGLRRRIGDALRLHFFATAGSLCALGFQGDFPSRLASAGQALTSRVSASVGVGLAVSFESFSLELNYCVPVRTCSGDLPSHGLQFGVGFSFL
jgi:outer membrane protein insertion porin family